MAYAFSRIQPISVSFAFPLQGFPSPPAFLLERLVIMATRFRTAMFILVPIEPFHA